MQTQNRFLDDLARVTSGAMGVAAGVRGEVEARVREQLERILAQMDLVPREEFEVVKAMAAKARSEHEELTARIAQLEVLLAEKQARTGSAKSSGAAAGKKTRPKAKAKSGTAQASGESGATGAADEK